MINESNLLRLITDPQDVEKAKIVAQEDFLSLIEPYGITVLPDTRERWWGRRGAV